MKTLIRLIIFCLLFLQAKNISYSQTTNYEDGVCIVRVNHQLLNLEVVDEFQNTIPLEKLLNNNGLNVLDESSLSESFDLANLEVNKLFYNLKTTDSISISRQGRKITIPPFWATYKINIPTGVPIRAFIKEINRHKDLFVYAHPNYNVISDSYPNDDFFSAQHSLFSPTLSDAHIHADSAWLLETGKPYIKVGVFDTGIDGNHEDIEVLTGYAYTPFIDESTVDIRGHGTSVAGIIGAKRNNTIGIAGIAGGNDTINGASILSFKTISDTGEGNADGTAIAVIDAARSVGTNYNWNDIYDHDSYFSNASGFGIHVGNHSYGINVSIDNEGIIDTGDPADSSVIIDSDFEAQECYLCKEAFLFSFQNGVVNVTSAGNGDSRFHQNRYEEFDYFPRAYDDSWVIVVGASAYDGNTVLDTINASPTETYFFSRFNSNLDVVAPGSDSIVYTLRSSEQEPVGDLYRKINGTSAAAPHVAGVAALILSYYNQNCYSSSNLFPDDVEYIIERSAVDIHAPGHDDTSGYGRLHAYHALKMIEFPTKQIWHHPPTITSSNITTDTIHFKVGMPLISNYIGPLSSSFILKNDIDYQVVKYEVTQTYSYAGLFPLNTEILDIYPRLSVTNTINAISDTTFFEDGNPATSPILVIDELKIEPYCELSNWDSINQSFQLTGYTYHFIKEYNPNFGGVEGGVFDVINSWYPFNINTDSIEMAISYYFENPDLTDWVTTPCDSLNELYDTLLYVNHIDNSTHDLIIYPNPNNGVLNILSENANIESVKLFSLEGKLITSAQTKGKTNFTQINLTDLTSGIYIINVRTDNNNLIVKKIIKS